MGHRMHPFLKNGPLHLIASMGRTYLIGSSLAFHQDIDLLGSSDHQCLLTLTPATNVGPHALVPAKPLTLCLLKRYKTGVKDNKIRN